MPVYSQRGSILAGIGTAPVSVDTRVIGTGGRGGWVTDNTVVYNRGENGWNVVTHNISTGETRIVLPGGANVTDGGGGVWAAFVATPSGGLYLSDGTHLRDAGAPSVGPDGAVAYSPNYQSGVGVDVREVSGEVWRLTNGIAYDIQLLGQGRAIWRNERFRVMTTGLPMIDPPITDAYRPRAAMVDGFWWVTYWSGSLALVSRPFNSNYGYKLGMGDKFAHDTIPLGADLGVVWAAREGEFPRDIVQIVLDLSMARVELVPEPPPVEPPVEPPIEPPVEPPVEPEPGPEPPEPPVTPSPTPPSSLTFRTHDGVHYICAELDGTLVADRTAAGVWETFAVVPGEGPGTSGLQTHHGRFWCAEEGGGGKLVANRARVGPWESFKVHHQPGGEINIETHDGHFVCAELGGGGEVNATRLGPGPWETFNGTVGPPPSPGPGPTPEPGGGFQGPLHKDGRVLRTPQNARWIWRGASSFRLLHMMANGEEAAAVGQMQKLSGLGYNLVRVLATAKHLFDLPRDKGLLHLERLFYVALEQGLYVEIVALADTEDWNKSQLEDQLSQVYLRANSHHNVLVEGANEMGPIHETQSDEVVDVCRGFGGTGAALYCPGSVHGGSFCDEQDALTEEQWEWGQEHDEWPYWDEVFTYSRSYGTSHLKRDGSDADRGRRVRELESSSNQANCLFVDDEPLGADETTQPGRRSAEPGVFYLQGVLSRIFEVGSTFHSQAGLTSTPFGPVQQGCAEAFINGSRIVADGVQLTFKNSGWHDSPVKEFSGAVRVYSGVGADNIACVIAPEPGFTIETQNGWRVGGVRADVTGCRVLNLVR